jgi:hypothetical protein
MRFACKRDQNEFEIFAALKAAHCQPVRGTDCDLYAISRTDMRGVLLEVKTEKGRLRPIQKQLQAIFGERYKVVRSVPEALAACGVQS